MLDPKTQAKILRLRAHAKMMQSLADELLGDGLKQNAKVKKLSYEQEADIEAKLRSKVIS
jgi:hypothetical protein